MSRDPAGWVSAHLFYHASLDRMIVELAGPLGAELAADGLIDGFFFLRYWDGGPHLRLRCRARPGAADAIRQQLLDRASRFFADHPATGGLDPDAYAAQAAWAARAEGETRYTRRPYPNHTVGFVRYRREHHRYGYGASMAAVERHFQESSQVALQVLARDPTTDQRATAGLCLILLAWLAAEPDPAWSARLRHHPSPAGGAQGSHGAEHQRRARAISSRMRALLARVDELPDTGNLAIWARSVSTLAATLTSTGSDRRAPILDLAAHLGCNRLGLPVEAEQWLRRLAAAALTAEPDHS